jgi:HK97 family phage portal protein
VGLLASIRSALARTPTFPVSSTGGVGGWSTVVVREPFTGAWQTNQEIRPDTALSHPALFACTTLIASDIGKLCLRLVAQDANGIWNETTNAAFSPVLRKPNRYQTTQKFIEQWVTSKLTWGNAYVLKQRDQRGVVGAMYVLDPTRTWPLVTPEGDIYYSLSRDYLAGAIPVPGEPGSIVVPASEVIHDLMVALFHPLIGVSPIFAAGLPALQGLNISNNATQFFGNGSNPGGVLLAPGKIADDTAKRLKDYWDTNFSGANVGKVAVLGDNLKYQPLAVNAVDAQLVEQLKWTTETICSCFHVPASLVDSSIQAPYGNNPEPLLQLYYSQCLQALMTGIETALDEGLELPKPYGTEFDVDDLIWMDTATRTKAAQDGIGGGALSPNEARKKYYGLGPVEGGDTPYLQQQNYSLSALNQRDQGNPFAPPPAPAPAPPPEKPAVSAKEVLAVHLAAQAIAQRIEGELHAG